MPTTTTTLPITDVALEPAEKALQEAYDAIESLTWAIRDVVTAYGDGTTPDPLPTYEDVGRLYLFAQHVRDVSTAQIAECAGEILAALPTFQDIIINAPKDEGA